MTKWPVIVGKEKFDGPVVKVYLGIHKETGETAYVQQTEGFEFAQFDEFNHFKSRGWWKHPLGTFKERIVTWETKPQTSE